MSASRSLDFTAWMSILFCSLYLIKCQYYGWILLFRLAVTNWILIKMSDLKLLEPLLQRFTSTVIFLMHIKVSSTAQLTLKTFTMFYYLDLSVHVHSSSLYPTWSDAWICPQTWIIGLLWIHLLCDIKRNVWFDASSFLGIWVTRCSSVPLFNTPFKHSPGMRSKTTWPIRITIAVDDFSNGIFLQLITNFCSLL